ncbi:MFS transporter [Oenococcus sp.]|uniref:MFS transporter n=1 Tax=Oenococcus sp. TaxID=1979414 RepID=UPI0039EA90C5
MQTYRTNKNFRTVIHSGLLSQIGSGLFNIVFLVYAAHMFDAKLAISMVALANLMPMVLAFLTGYAADNTKKQVDRLISNRWLQTILYLLQALLIYLAIFRWWSFLLLVVINIASDLISSYNSGLILPLEKKIVAKEQLESALGLNSSLSATVGLVSSVLGMTLFELLNSNYMLFSLINALSFALAGLLIFVNRRDLSIFESKRMSTSLQRPSLLHSSKHMIVFFQQNKLIMIYILLFALVNFIGPAISPLLNISLLHANKLLFVNFGWTVSLMGVVYSVGEITGSLFVNDIFKGLSILQILALDFVSLILFSGVIIYLQNRYLMFGLFALIGYFIGKMEPKINAFFIGQIDESILAASVGVLNTLIGVAMPLGQFLFLAAANIFVPQLAWVLLSLASLIGLLLTIAATFKQVETTKAAVGKPLDK